MTSPATTQATIQTPPPPPPPGQPLSRQGRRQRLTFIDRYRGFACLLMFEAHAYDRWIVDNDRRGPIWDFTRHLAGFPSRLFLLLAGVALVFKLSAQAKRKLDERACVKSNVMRGVEVIGLALGFRVFEWALGGGQWFLWRNMLRVDILNCIGISLVIASWLLKPRHAADLRMAAKLGIAALGIAWVTPVVERWSDHSFITANPLAWYVTGKRPDAFFPLFPWLSFLLAGCAAGIVWVHAIASGAREKLVAAVRWTSLAGALMVGAAALVSYTLRGVSLFATRDPGVSAPDSFLYRTGMCLVGAGIFFAIYERTRSSDAAVDVTARFSWLQQLGQTSLFVYWVHVEMVYGHLSRSIHHKLSFAVGTLLLALLTAFMVLLSVLKTRYMDKLAKWRAKKSRVQLIA